MYVGVDLGGTNIAVGMVEDGRIVCKTSVKTKSQRPYGEIIKDMAETIERLAADNGISLDLVKSIGVGTPGTPDIKNGTVFNIFNICQEALPIRAELQKHIKKPVFIENDARCAALGEFISGSSRGYSNSVMLTLGTGVGSGIIIGNKLYTGLNYGAGEIGHMVIAAGGHKCSCGNFGCFEQYASVTGLVRMAKEKIISDRSSDLYKLVKNGAEIDGLFVFNCAKSGDILAKQVVDKYISYISIGITNIINIFQPEIIVIGGGISAEGEYLISPIRETVRKNAFTKNLPIAQIKKASLGNDAGIVGAAMLEEYQTEG
ncbi:MAG: ROK family protein [Clostridia bacterium]|nr:ROK family protein [Clostridia bacterium]